MHEAWNRRPRALAHADRLAKATKLDMVAAGWTPTVGTYLGRVTKARIVAAVREARGEHAAQLIDHLKRGEMAEKAQELLAGSGWLPEPLRTPGHTMPSATEAASVAADEPAAREAEVGSESEPHADHGTDAECVDPDSDAASALAAE